MSWIYALSVRAIAKQVAALIEAAVQEGRMLSRTVGSIRKALALGNGFAIIQDQIVMAYAECVWESLYHILKSVVVIENGRGAGLGIEVVINRLEECWCRDPKKPVILVCPKDSVAWYSKFGFKEMEKAEAPSCIIGGRTFTDWMASDRVWMTCRKSSYDQKKRGISVMRPNVGVKISGNVLEKEETFEFLRKLTRKNYVTVVAGGGKQINDAFEQAGYQIKFCPLGRIADSLPERQLARNVLEQNQAMLQDLLDEKGINVRVVIPVIEIGGVTCPVNGDVMILAAYLGYDKLYILTEAANVEKKKKWLADLAKSFSSIEEGELDKIEVVGF